MRATKVIPSVFVLLASVLLMGQSTNCSDLGKLMPQIEKMLRPGETVYVSNLSYIDIKTKSIMTPGDADLINKAVEDGLSTLSTQDPKYHVNETGHTLKNNDANAQKLSDIFSNVTLSHNEIIDKVIAELMQPNHVDGLVAGRYEEDANGINLYPFAISTKDRKMVSTQLNFKKDEFKCPDPNVANASILCEKARNDIHDAVVREVRSLD